MTTIPAHHKAAFLNYSETERIRYFQKGYSGYTGKVDGDYGPITAKAADDYIAGVIGAPLGVSRMQAVFDSAKRDTGKREAPMGSNGGPYVDGLRDEVKLQRLAGGEWCAVFQSVHLHRSGILVKSRGAPGVVRGIINLPEGREVDIGDIGVGFYGMALRKRGRRTHHVQIFRTYDTDNGMRIEHVGGNEKHQVVNKDDWKPAKFFKGVIQVAALS